MLRCHGRGVAIAVERGLAAARVCHRGALGRVLQEGDEEEGRETRQALTAVRGPRLADVWYGSMLPSLRLRELRHVVFLV